MASQLPLLRSLPTPLNLSTAHVKTSLAPGRTLTTKFSVRRAPDTNSLSLFFSGGGFPRPFVSTKVGLARAGLAADNTQGTVVSLTRLGRGLVADFAVVALAATLGATVGSESPTQPAAQQLFWIHPHEVQQ